VYIIYAVALFFLEYAYVKANTTLNAKFTSAHENKVLEIFAGLSRKYAPANVQVI